MEPGLSSELMSRSAAAWPAPKTMLSRGGGRFKLANNPVAGALGLRVQGLVGEAVGGGIPRAGYVEHVHVLEAPHLRERLAI
jgi:hypothetical protein